MNKVTIGILTYNHEKFIAKCLNSVLALHYENLEIVISDDCSRDNTLKIVEDIVAQSQSSHQIIINRNEVNLGLAQNFNKTFYELATGEFLITLGGDDIIIENYISEALILFESSDLMMIDFNGIIINEKGVELGIADNINYASKLFSLNDYLNLSIINTFAPGRIIRKNLITEFLPINNQCPTEDSVLVFRALLLGNIIRINKIAVQYRKHSANISNPSNLVKLPNSLIISQYLKDLLYVFENRQISSIQFKKILNRINYELKKREIQYNSHYVKLTKSIKLRSLMYITKLGL